MFEYRKSQAFIRTIDQNPRRLLETQRLLNLAV